MTDIKRCYPVMAAMERHDLPLPMHGEVTDPDMNAFDGEAVFIERHLAPLVRAFPALRTVLEHFTTSTAAELVSDAPDNVEATITAHHLLLNRNAVFEGGLQPHHYRLPLLNFFLGTDNAPRPRYAKESACGCAGIYNRATARSRTPHHPPLRRARSSAGV